MTAANYKTTLERRTKHFAVSVFRMVDHLPQFVFTRTIANQLGKAAEAIRAKYTEANQTESADGFVLKIAVALKECSEAKYWLEVLSELYPANQTITDLSAENAELIKLLTLF